MLSHCCYHNVIPKIQQPIQRRCAKRFGAPSAHGAAIGTTHVLECQDLGRRAQRWSQTSDGGDRHVHWSRQRCGDPGTQAGCGSSSGSCLSVSFPLTGASSRRQPHADVCWPLTQTISRSRLVRASAFASSEGPAETPTKLAPAFLAGATDGTIHILTAYGEASEATSAPPGAPARAVCATDPTAFQVVGLRGGGLVVSTDGGATWAGPPSSANGQSFLPADIEIFGVSCFAYNQTGVGLQHRAFAVGDNSTALDITYIPGGGQSPSWSLMAVNGLASSKPTLYSARPDPTTSDEPLERQNAALGPAWQFGNTFLPYPTCSCRFLCCVSAWSESEGSGAIDPTD